EAGVQVGHFRRDEGQEDVAAYTLSLAFLLNMGIESLRALSPYFGELKRMPDKPVSLDVLTGPGVREQAWLIVRQWFLQEGGNNRIDPLWQLDPLARAILRKSFDPLPYAIHTLQDSFSPSHVRRDEKTLEINELFAFDTENQNPSAVCQTVPVPQGLLINCTQDKSHKLKDIDYRDPSRKDGLTPLASAAVDAGADLLRCVM